MTEDDTALKGLDISELLIPIRERKHPATTIVSFDGLLQKPLRLKEDLKEGCGGQLWPAGMLLARYMLREHRSNLLGKTMSVYTPSSCSFRETIRSKCRR
jgi:hypothetical protein